MPSTVQSKVWMWHWVVLSMSSSKEKSILEPWGDECVVDECVLWMSVWWMSVWWMSVWWMSVWWIGVLGG